MVVECGQQEIESLLARWDKLKAEYALPNNEIDAGNLYWFAGEFENVIRAELSTSRPVKTLGETAAYLDTIWHHREDLGWLNFDAFLTADDVKMLIDFIYGERE